MKVITRKDGHENRLQCPSRNCFYNLIRVESTAIPDVGVVLATTCADGHRDIDAGVVDWVSIQLDEGQA